MPAERITADERKLLARILHLYLLKSPLLTRMVDEIGLKVEVNARRNIRGMQKKVTFSQGCQNVNYCSPLKTG